MKDSKAYIAVIGGSNLDIVGYPYGDLKKGDSNPGKTTLSFGGVGQNIGTNLIYLGIATKLITALGNDIYGEMILKKNQEIGLNMDESLILDRENTSTYLALLNRDGDMEIALASMDIVEKITSSFIKEKKRVIENAHITIVDTNIPKDTIEYMVKNHKGKFFLDTVSTTKAMKVKDILGYFHTIKPNKLEAEILSGIKINTKEDIKKVGKFFIKKGVERVFITLGDKGVYYFDKNTELYIRAPSIKVVNATGAGDAFMAALGYAYINSLDIEDTLKFAIATSILTLESEETISPNISVKNILEKVKELGL